MKVPFSLIIGFYLLLAFTANGQAWTDDNPPLRYIVQKGDSLEGLAKTFEVTVSDIVRWNNLTSLKLREGQELIVAARRPAKQVDGFIFWRVPMEKKSQGILEKTIEEKFEKQLPVPVVVKTIDESDLPAIVIETPFPDTIREIIQDTISQSKAIPDRPDLKSDIAVWPLKIDTMPAPVKSLRSDTGIYLEADLLNDSVSEAVMLVKIYGEGDNLPVLKKEIYIQKIFFERIDTTATSGLLANDKNNESAQVEDEGYLETEAVEPVDTIFIRQNAKRIFYDTVAYQPDTLIAPRLLFCGGVELGVPVGISNLFLKNVGKNYIYAFYEQNQPIQTKQIIVEFYEKNDSDELLLFDERNYEIKPRWKHTYFKCRFPHPGEYTVVLYDEQKNIMGKAGVTIQNY